METLNVDLCNNAPLVVDLDGTLINTDLLYESLLINIKKNPLILFLVIFWLFHGIAYLKYKLSENVILPVALLPYNKTLLRILNDEYANGKKIVLATASYISFANQIADYLKIFSQVIATDKFNMKGKRKLSELQKKFWPSGFKYAGDSKDDLPIFAHADSVILVAPKKNVRKNAEQFDNIDVVIEKRPDTLLTYAKALRVHQWLKNILIFVPLITSHSIFNTTMLLKAFSGFLIFSLCASGTYILNDLFDLFSDRAHLRKKNRPFASGDLSIPSGIFLSFFLILASNLVAFIIDLQFGILTITYLILTLSYSWYFKSAALIDTILLASLYTIRVITGAELICVDLSFWLISFSIFIFYSLALLKRVTELQDVKSRKTVAVAGREYTFQDLASIRTIGISSGFLSIVVFALYINSSDVLMLYSRPQVLWLICPIILYWINRIWLKTGRNEMHDDPIVFTIKDKGSLVMFAVGLLLMAIAS